jgi:hypothetical protein
VPAEFGVECVVDLDAEVADDDLELRMTEKRRAGCIKAGEVAFLGFGRRDLARRAPAARLLIQSTHSRARVTRADRSRTSMCRKASQKKSRSICCLPILRWSSTICACARAIGIVEGGYS